MTRDPFCWDIESRRGMTTVTDLRCAHIRYQSRSSRTVTARQWATLRRLGVVLAILFLTILFFVPSLRPTSILGVLTLGLFSYDGSEAFQIETVRYYDLSHVSGTSRGWERGERILLCAPLRDAADHLPMFFSHLRNLTYPHHLIDLAFLVGDSKDNTTDLLSDYLAQLQASGAEDINMPFGEISVIEKDFGQKVKQDSDSRHGFAAQASRRKSMAQARNWLLSAALRPTHSWVYWRDVDVETAPAKILEDLMKHNADVIVPSKFSMKNQELESHRSMTGILTWFLFQTSGALSPTGSAANSLTISTAGKNLRRPSSSPKRSTRTLSLSKATLNMQHGVLIWPTYAILTVILIRRWTSMA